MRPRRARKAVRVCVSKAGNEGSAGTEGERARALAGGEVGGGLGHARDGLGPPRKNEHADARRGDGGERKTVADRRRKTSAKAGNGRRRWGAWNRSGGGGGGRREPMGAGKRAGQRRDSGGVDRVDRQKFPRAERGTRRRAEGRPGRVGETAPPAAGRPEFPGATAAAAERVAAGSAVGSARAGVEGGGLQVRRRRENGMKKAGTRSGPDGQWGARSDVDARRTRLGRSTHAGRAEKGRRGRRGAAKGGRSGRSGADAGLSPGGCVVETARGGGKKRASPRRERGVDGGGGGGGFKNGWRVPNREGSVWSSGLGFSSSLSGRWMAMGLLGLGGAKPARFAVRERGGFRSPRGPSGRACAR